ncbi:MAG: hypothetical protein VB096_03075 [Pseudoflavonifractor sp.]|nr:hypothetical protein [Pseudoflavonifractor sp.]
MKKRIFPLALVLALCLSLCANAAVAPCYINSFSKTPKLTVYSATAECGLTVRSNPGAKITARVVGMRVRVSVPFLSDLMSQQKKTSPAMPHMDIPV